MKRLLALTLLFVIAVVLCAKAGSFLIVDQPRPSDVILVLAGETNLRPARALLLLSKGYRTPHCSRCPRQLNNLRIHAGSTGAAIHSRFAAGRVGEHLLHCRIIDKR